MIRAASLPGHRLSERWSHATIVVSLLVILYTTLFPFDFYAGDKEPLLQAVRNFDVRFTRPSTSGDLIRNIFLFLPLGFGLTDLAIRRTKPARATLIAVLFISFTLSFSIEYLQSLLPDRTASLIDILANTAGGGVGFLYFCWWGNEILAYSSIVLGKLSPYLSVGSLAVGLSAYALLVSYISISLHNRVNFDNWDPAYPLVLGNAATGDRPWRGYISELFVMDRAVTEAEAAHILAGEALSSVTGAHVLAFYQFQEDTDFQDTTGNLPALKWRGTSIGTRETLGVSLRRRHWLQTAGPATILNQNVAARSQFTISVIAATANVQQNGPASILSLSANPSHRNLTIGQQGADLVLRLRTPASGRNGLRPELLVPNVFADAAPHHLIITFDGKTIFVFVDSVQNVHTFKLSPEVTFFRHFLPTSTWQIRIDQVNPVYRLLYRSIALAPLAFLLAMILTLSRQALALRAFLGGATVLLLSLLLEAVLAQVWQGHPYVARDVLLSFITMATTTCLFTLWLR